MSDTTWSEAGSPYVITNSIEISGGAVLTIEPGATVRFNNQTDIAAYGQIVAEGTAAKPILISGSTATPGHWESISFYGTEGSPNVGSRFRYVTVEYGGNYYGNFYLYYASVRVRDCLFRHSAGDGIYGDYGGVAHLIDVEFTDNAGYPVQFRDGSVNPNLARVSATGNGENAIAVGYGHLQGKHTWENCGIPYVLTSDINIDEDAHLYVQPGTTVGVDPGVAINAYGRLIAAGTEAEPILFTGTQTTPGSWQGISIIGTTGLFNAGSVFKHATVEYGGGYYANVYIDQAQVAISNSIIRHSSADGVYLYYAGIASTVERSRIVSNAGYGIQNENAVDPANVLLAANNWWGDATGPHHPTLNPGGSGQEVSDGVAFMPFLTSPAEDPGPVAPSDARILSIKPRRWFAPADGVSRIWVTLALRDGTGVPLPGRTVNLHSSHGTVTAGGITDLRGETLAYIVSDTAGDARLTASLVPDAAGEFARSPAATVTFEAGAADDDLMPDAAAPYSNEYIQIRPLPVTRGVPTSLTVKLINPNSFPVSINGTFSIADYGIGLTFGPIGEVIGHVIPADGESVIGVSWTPIVSGHYCIEFEYAAQNVPGLIARQWDRRGRTSHNVFAAPGALESEGGKEALDRAEQATGAINTASSVVGPESICPGTVVGWFLDWIYGATRTISRALGGDPPRQDYTSYVVPPKPSIAPFAAGGDLSAARAAAWTDFTDAMLDVITAGRAAIISLDRYGGAAAAGDLTWASQQASALVYHKENMGRALLSAADRLETVLTVAQSEGFSDYIVTDAQIRAYQDRLRTSGFTTDEINAAHALGITDAEIEATRQERMAADPSELGGSQLAYINNLIQVYRDLGNILVNPPNFGTSGGGLVRRTASGNKLTRVFETSYPVPVGNPTSATASIALSARRIDLPPDWMVDVTPSSATLAAGERTTATVSVRAGTATVQGTQPRLAVEARIDGNLIGGVTLDVVVPHEAVYGSRNRAVRWMLYR